MSWFKNPLDFAEGLLDQVDRRVSSVVGPSPSQDGDTERPTGHTTRQVSEPLQSTWDDHRHDVISKPEAKEVTPIVSPAKSPTRSSRGTVKLPPRKIPPRTSPATTSETVQSTTATSLGGEDLPSSVDGAASKPQSTPSKHREVAPVPPSPAARPSPQPTPDRSLPVASAATDLASSPPVASKSRTKKLPVKPVKAEKPVQQSSSPAARSDATGASDEGTGWLATVPKQPQAAGTSPHSSASSISAAALQPPAAKSPTHHQLPRPPTRFASKPAASPATPGHDHSTTAVAQAEPEPAPAEPVAPFEQVASTAAPGNGSDQPHDSASSNGNGNGMDSHRADETVPQHESIVSETVASSIATDSEPQPDVTADVPMEAGTKDLWEKLDKEVTAKRKLETELSKLREDLTAAQGRAAVAEAGLAEAEDHLTTMENRATSAEEAASHADGAAHDAQRSADDAAATAAAAAAAAEARASAASDAAAAARSKAREAMQRADLKADALRSCEARLGQLETELEETSTARDAALSDASKLRAELASTTERAVAQGNEAVDSLQKELNAAQEAASIAQEETRTERASAAEARITAERRLEAMEGALGIAHAEASQSTRAAEEAVEALETAEAANASLQQRLAEATSGTAAGHPEVVGGFSELQARLDSTEARYRELEHAASQSHHRAEELEQELMGERSGTARHAMQDLQGQLKQANQLLAERQAMWENTAAEHAARSLTLERQLAQVQDKLQTAGRQAHSGGDRRAAPLSGGEDVIPMDSLHGYYRFVSHRRFGKAFKAIGGTVDSVTAQVVSVLRRNPLARVAVLLYVLFVHLLIYVLLGRMQHHAAIATVAHDLPPGTGADITGTLSRFDTPINKIQHL